MNRRPLLSSLLLGVVAITCSQVGETGESRKLPSGRSYLATTVVERAPSASAAATGFDAERVWSGHDDWEPAVAADPSSSFVYQLTTRYSGPKACSNCPFPVIVFRASADDGATWGPDRFFPITRKPQNDPQIEVATDGTIYAAWLDDYRPGVKFIKSADRGVTWSEPIAFTGKGKKPAWSDRPVLAISPDGRDVYVAFNASDSWVAASHDYGVSFAPAVKTSNDTRYWFHSAGAVAPDGDVFFATADYSQDYSGDSHVGVLKSSNGGATWAHTRLDTSSEMPDCPWAVGCYFGFFGPSVGVAVDLAGTVVVAYHAGGAPGAPQPMYVRTSTNGGSTWSTRQQVSVPDPAVHNGFPALGAGGAAGDFRLVWQDTRGGGTNAWNTWFRETANGGATWSAAVRLSDQTSGAPYKHANGYRFPYGDYLEIAVDAGGRNHIIWGEGDSFTGPGGTWYTGGPG